MATTPTVELGLGGSFLGNVLAETDVSYWPMFRYASGILAAFTTGVYAYPSTTSASGLTVFGSVADSASNLPSQLPEGGYAITLNGTSQYMTHDHPRPSWLPATDPFSIEVVLTLNALPSVGDEPCIMGNSAFALTYKDDGKVYAYHNGSSFANYVVAAGSRVHLALTRAGTSTDSINFYVNGTNRGSTTPARVSFNLDPMYFGIHWSVADYLSATYEFAAVYPSELSSARVSAHYAALSWTDVTADTLGERGLVCERGIRDDGPGTRVASTGTLTFSLNNLGSNSGGVTGYYSPGHASCRTGFAKGIAVRMKTGSNVQFLGRIRTIEPTPGKSGGGTKVLATDFIDQAATFLLENAATVLENVTGDQVFKTVVGLMSATPNGMETSTGSETYTLALDNTRDESVPALQEFHRLALSELGYIYVTREGTLVYENRNTRISASGATAAYTLADTMHGIDVAEVSASALNRVQVTVHPRVIDAAATTVLFALTNPLQIAPGAGGAKTILGPYRTTESPGITTRVGGLSMVTPVANTDYTMNSESDGSGTDLTSFLTVTASFGANGVRFDLENNAPDSAYITLLQCRGKGVYDFRTVVLRAQNDAAIASDGVNAQNLDMPYQEDPDVGQAIADLLLAGYGDLTGSRVRRLMVYPDDAGVPANLLTADIGTRVAVSETVTGATGEYYINGIRQEFKNGTLPKVTWWLTPAEPVSYWLLGTAGLSELDDTTMLGAA